MSQPRHIRVGDIVLGNDLPLVLIAGPCAIEGRAHALETAEALKGIAAEAGIALIYKSSYDKANRTSLDAPRGVGMAQGLDVLAEVRDIVGCPVLTDVHAPEQCADVAAAVDVLQIPAFLCRQTDLIVAAAMTGRPLNIKKGQFLAPWDMANVVAKAEKAGNT
ncbi:MAG: 3-deoxy-8-phosphooctulonate synthase, partial [Alphaproteobacteria bacterium]